MILHLAQDDKFIDQIISLFEKAAEGENKYVVWQASTKKTPSYFQKITIDSSNRLCTSNPPSNRIKKSSFAKINHKELHAANYGSQDFFNAIGDLSKYRFIVFHSLVYNQAKLATIIKAHIDIPMVWSPFGYEVYNMLPEFKKDLYLPSTRRFVRQSATITNWLQDKIDHFKSKTIRKAIQSVDYCAIAIDTEFELYRDRINPKLKRCWFTYYPIDQFIGSSENTDKSNHILVGNSAFPSNNHIESFIKLSEQNTKGRKIICPLSYGSPILTDKVLKIGKTLFQDRFQPLTEFMPLEDYHQLIASCQSVIMNQSRQQAFGNVLAALWNGSSVFLRSTNTIYSYLKNKGVTVFDIEKDLEFQLNQSLNPSQIEANKKFIRDEYSLNHIVSKTQELIQLCSR